MQLARGSGPSFLNPMAGAAPGMTCDEPRLTVRSERAPTSFPGPDLDPDQNNKPCDGLSSAHPGESFGGRDGEVEKSHDCCGAARQWDFASDGAEWSCYGQLAALPAAVPPMATTITHLYNCYRPH